MSTSPSPPVPPAAVRFAVGIVACGAVALAWAVVDGGLAAYASAPVTLLVFAALTLVAEQVVIKLPHERDDVTMTAGRLFAFGLLLGYGTGPAVLAWSAAVLLSDLRARRPLLRAAFNTAQYALAMSAAGAVLTAVSDLGARGGHDLSSADAPAVLLAGATLWLLNHSLASVVSSLAMGISLRAWARREPTTVLVIDALMLGYAPVLDLVAGHGLGLVPLLAIPFGALYLSAREAERRKDESLHDALTGLPNRSFFTQTVEEVLRAARAGGPVPAVLLLDVDRFKEVNDALGHRAGDEVLEHVAARLREVADPDDFVARLGGDEFGVIRRAPRDDAAPGALAARIRSALEAPVLVSGVHVSAGASIGIARDSGDGACDLIRRADVAMYAAKAEDGVAHYDPLGDPHGPERLARISELREGIPRDELVVFFQPQLSLRSGRVRGAEALVRWQHPRSGLLPPSEFIELAETSGLMEPLTMSVLAAALDEAAGWRRAGADLSVAVNLAAQTLLDQRLAPRIAAMLDERGLPGCVLVLEITERTLMRDVSRAASVLEELGALGVRVSVDDFGTGYSSLALLRRLSVHEIKIDRSFVRDMTVNRNDAAIVHSTIGLGRTLGLEVVAEGVETADALEQLTALGCHSAQGYLISRPLPAEDFASWLHARGEPAGGVVVPLERDRPRRALAAEKVPS